MPFYCTAAVLECPGLEDPPNGMVTVMDNVPGSVAMYICDSGYMLSAQGDRNCERLGERDTQWGGVPPTCTRTFVYTQNLPTDVKFPMCLHWMSSPTLLTTKLLLAFIYYPLPSSLPLPCDRFCMRVQS